MRVRVPLREKQIAITKDQGSGDIDRGHGSYISKIGYMGYMSGIADIPRVGAM